jgi:hypothetical protein
MKKNETYQCTNSEMKAKFVGAGLVRSVNFAWGKISRRSLPGKCKVPGLNRDPLEILGTFAVHAEKGMD